MNIVTRVQGVIEGPVHPPTRPAMPEMGIPYCLVLPLASVILETYPPPLAPIPSRGMYTYTYMPSPIISGPPVA